MGAEILHLLDMYNSFHLLSQHPVPPALSKNIWTLTQTRDQIKSADVLVIETNKTFEPDNGPQIYRFTSDVATKQY
jgi:hypothetical protein